MRRPGPAPTVLAVVCTLLGAESAAQEIGLPFRPATPEADGGAVLPLRPAAGEARGALFLPHPDHSDAFVVGALGGTAGSLLGLGAGVLLLDPDDCGEDLGCTLSKGAGVMLVGTAGSAAGAWGAGRWAETDPSGWGALGGAVVGLGAGAAVFKLLDEGGTELGRGAAAVLFSVIQGVFSALGSRLLH